MSSKDNDEERVMDSRSYNIELMINDKEYFLLPSRCLMRLEAWMKGMDFIFDCVNLLQYKCHRINFKRFESYLDFPDWIKNKKAAINPVNEIYQMLSICCNSGIK